MAIKITKKEKRKPGEREEVRVKTKADTTTSTEQSAHAWWNATSKRQLAQELMETASFLKKEQAFRYREAGIYSRLYGNLPLSNFVGNSAGRISRGMNLPIGRATMNVIQSVIDTKVARITQNRPRPVYQTDDADSKQRKIAKQMNMFINGEFYQTKAYDQGRLILRDASVLGTGALKVVEDLDHKVSLERRLIIELLVDHNESLYGNPRQLYEVKMVDRSVLQAYYPDYRNDIAKAENAFPDESGEAAKTVSDMCLVVESWRLPAGKDTGDGRHTIACSNGVVFDEPWTKQRFPFVFLHDSPQMWGFWGQGAPARLMGCQMEINQMLQTASQSVNLMGVPRIFIEDGSKIAKAHFNNNVGMMATYSGTPPTVVDGGTGLTDSFFAHLSRIIGYAYQQEGVSSMSAAGEIANGIKSGEAIRSFDNLSTDRMATLARDYSNFYQELAYQMIDLAVEICDREGKYETVYPDKNGAHRIDLPSVKKMEDPFVIQCADMSSLPLDPAGRQERITEWMQAGIITPQEGRRLIDFPDLGQVDKLANAQEERIYSILDSIVEDGKYTAPDPYLLGPDPQMPTTIGCQYYNRFADAKLEPSRLKMLRDFMTQVMALKAAAMPPPPMPAGPLGAPAAPPVSGLLPNAPKAV